MWVRSFAWTGEQQRADLGGAQSACKREVKLRGFYVACLGYIKAARSLSKAWILYLSDTEHIPLPSWESTSVGSEAK